MTQIGQWWWANPLIITRWIGPESQGKWDAGILAIDEDLGPFPVDLSDKGRKMARQHLCLLCRQCRFHIGISRNGGKGTTPSLAAIKRLQALLQRNPRRTLQKWIDCRAHRQATRVEHVLAIFGDQRTPHLLGKIGGIGSIKARLCGNCQWLGNRCFGLSITDIAIAGHLPQYPVTPVGRRSGLANRVIVGRCLWQCGQIGNLGQRQLIQRLVKIIESGSSNAIAAIAKIDLIQIKFQDLVLGKGTLHPQ